MMMGLELLLVPVLIVLAVWFINQTQNRAADRRGDSPDEVLRRRFADGEIDVEEYERRLALLRR
jgi:uncharacterized membrane protein